MEERGLEVDTERGWRFQSCCEKMRINEVIAINMVCQGSYEVTRLTRGDNFGGKWKIKYKLLIEIICI